MTIEQLNNMEPLFGSWHIVKLIGEGGFGQVYEIQREEFGTVYKAALKVITIPKNQSEVKSVMANGMDKKATSDYFKGIVQDMTKEFSLMDKVKGNTNIVGYADHQVIEHTDDIGWDILIRMELLTPLSEYLEKHTMSENEVIRLGIDICRALEVCERYNIIHRDIKIDNIFISEGGDYKLGDFGIARTMDKAQQASTQVGTKQYAAPEIIQGKKYTSNVDTYSLGMLMYRLLNNNRMPFFPPFPEPIQYIDTENAIQRRMSGESVPVIPTKSIEMNRILQKATSYESADRYVSARNMRDDLTRLGSGGSETNEVYQQKNQYNPVNNTDTLTMEMSDDITRTERLFTDQNHREHTNTITMPQMNTNTDVKASYVFNNHIYQREKKETNIIKKTGMWIALVAVVILMSVLLGILVSENLKETDKTEEDITENDVEIEDSSIKIVGIMPDVKGIDLKEATDKLDEIGIPYRVRYHKVENPMDGRKVIDQSIDAGVDVMDGEEVAIDAYYEYEIKINEEIALGSYEQDGNESNGKEKLIWQVISVKDGKALIISKDIIECMSYINKRFDITTYENSKVRNWLNNDFINDSFNSDDLKCICDTNVDNDYEEIEIFKVNNGEQTQYAMGGNDTLDKVFLISRDEIEKYLRTDNRWDLCDVTEHVRIEVENNDFYYAWGVRDWWYDNYLEEVKTYSMINTVGYGTQLSRDGRTDLMQGVRPCMWIDVSKYMELIKYEE